MKTKYQRRRKIRGNGKICQMLPKAPDQVLLACHLHCSASLAAFQTTSSYLRAAFQSEYFAVQWFIWIQKHSAALNREKNVCLSQWRGREPFHDTKNRFDSFCRSCSNSVTLNSSILLTVVTAYGLNQLGLDNNMWPIFVTQMNTNPGRLNCTNCDTQTSEPVLRNVLNSCFLFIEKTGPALFQWQHFQTLWGTSSKKTSCSTKTTLTI